MNDRVVSGFLLALLALNVSSVLLSTLVRQAKAVPDPWNMPVVYIQSILLGPSTLRVNVAVYNLTNTFYPTNEEWFPGQPLGAYAEPSRYNYSLGNLYAFDVSISRNPTVLEYINHYRTVPRGTTPQPFRSKGILNTPFWLVVDEVDPVAGTYRLACSSYYPASSFNAPEDAANTFSMTFTILGPGDYELSLDSVDLIVNPIQLPNVVAQIPYRTIFDPYVPSNIGIDAAPRNKDVVGEGKHFTVYALVKNTGDSSETCNVTIYASNSVGDYSVGNASTTVPPRSVQSINILGSTADLAKGTYTLKAVAEAVSGETYTADNTVIQGMIIVSIVGDVDGNRSVNIFDIVKMAGPYGECLPSLQYDPYTDLDNDGCSDIFDIVYGAMNYGRSW